MAKFKGPYLPGTEEIMAAGIDPKTNLPLRISNGRVKGAAKQFFRIMDEQDAVNRYTWFNLPEGITGQELERMLYYKGQLCFFYFKELDKFYFMPYALDGTIDFYGRYNRIHPVPLTGGKDDDENTSLLSEIKLNCVYDIKTEQVSYDDMVNSAVILRDYTNQLAQNITPRQIVNDELIDSMSNCLCYMDTALMMGTGVRGVRVNDADQASSVNAAARALKNAALNQEAYAAIVGNIEFQELLNGPVAKAEEYLLALQALDNLRLSGYGLENGGLFQKKAHELQSEADMASVNVGLINQDGLTIRQHFADVVNSIWGLGIWCEPSENVSGADINGDGVTYDESNEQGGTEDANDSNV